MPPGGSKVGGRPDVPPGFVWPSEEGGDPLTFVCQIDLAECGSPLLPPRGVLYLFSIADADRAYSYEIDDSTAAVRFVADPTMLAPASAPGAAEIEERALRLGSSFTCEEVGEDGAPSHRRFDRSVERAIDEAVEAAGGCGAGPTRLLGQPHFFREEFRADFYASLLRAWRSASHAGRLPS